MSVLQILFLFQKNKFTMVFRSAVGRNSEAGYRRFISNRFPFKIRNGERETINYQYSLQPIDRICVFVKVMIRILLQLTGRLRHSEQIVSGRIDH
jgi:hypothetical protein